MKLKSKNEKLKSMISLRTNGCDLPLFNFQILIFNCQFQFSIFKMQIYIKKR